MKTLIENNARSFKFNKKIFFSFSVNATLCVARHYTRKARLYDYYIPRFIIIFFLPTVYLISPIKSCPLFHIIQSPLFNSRSQTYISMHLYVFFLCCCCYIALLLPYKSAGCLCFSLSRRSRKVRPWKKNKPIGIKHLPSLNRGRFYKDPARTRPAKRAPCK